MKKLNYNLGALLTWVLFGILVGIPLSYEVIPRRFTIRTSMIEYTLAAPLIVIFNDDPIWEETRLIIIFTCVFTGFIGAIIGLRRQKRGFSGNGPSSVPTSNAQTPIPEARTTFSQPILKVTDIQSAKQGALIGGWLCFLIAITIMFFSLWGFIFYGPLFLAAFILSILAMSQRRILGGILLLIATLIVPLIWGLVFTTRVNAFASQNTASSSLPKQADIFNGLLMGNTASSSAAEGDTLTVPEANPTSSKYAGKYLQVKKDSNLGVGSSQETITAITAGSAPFIYEAITTQPIKHELIAKQLSTEENDFDKLDEFSKKEFLEKLNLAIAEKRESVRETDLYSVSADVMLEEYDFEKDAFPSGLATEPVLRVSSSFYAVCFSNKEDLLFIPVERVEAKELSRSLGQSRMARITYTGTLTKCVVQDPFSGTSSPKELVPTIYLKVSSVRITSLANTDSTGSQKNVMWEVPINSLSNGQETTISDDRELTASNVPTIYEIKAESPTPIQTILDAIEPFRNEGQVDTFEKQRLEESVREIIEKRKKSAQDADFYALVEYDYRLGEYDPKKNGFLIRKSNDRSEESNFFSQLVSSPSGPPYAVRFSNGQQCRYFPATQEQAAALAPALNDSRFVKISFIGTLDKCKQEPGLPYDKNGLVKVLYLKVSEIQMLLDNTKLGHGKMLSYKIPVPKADAPSKSIKKIVIWDLNEISRIASGKSARKGPFYLTGDFTVIGFKNGRTIMKHSDAGSSDVASQMNIILERQAGSEPFERGGYFEAKPDQPVLITKIEETEPGWYDVYVRESDDEQEVSTEDAFRPLDGSDTNSPLGGIGAETDIRNGVLTILSSDEGFPAFKAGLQADDQIIRINDVTTVGLTHQECVDRIRGKVGDKILLTIRRPSTNEVKNIEMIRASIGLSDGHTTETTGGPNVNGNPVPQPEPLQTRSVPPVLPARTAIVAGIKSGDILNVRATPASSSEAVFQLVNGQQVQIRGESAMNGPTEWVPIAVGSDEGWVVKKYLREEKVEPPKPQSPDQIRGALSNLLNQAGNSITKAVSDSLDLPVPSPTPHQNR